MVEGMPLSFMPRLSITACASWENNEAGMVLGVALS